MRMINVHFLLMSNCAHEPFSRRDVTEGPVTRFLGLSMLSAPVIQSQNPTPTR